VSPDAINAIRKKSQESLIEFLRGDIALGFTFLQTAEIDVVDDPAHSKAAVEKARKALNAIRYFVVRVDNPAIREEIESEASRLEGDIGRF
jgi:hypothetical protein